MHPDGKPERTGNETRPGQDDADQEQRCETTQHKHRLRKLIERMRERGEPGKPPNERRSLLRRLEKMDEGENRGAQKIRWPRPETAQQNSQEQSAKERFLDGRNNHGGG